MKQILVQLHEPLAKLLDQVAPGRGRKRSQFIRQAIVRALMEVAEVQTRRAYEREPDRDDDDWWFDAEGWAPESEAIHPPQPLRRTKRKVRKR
ncbi:MAG TPA: hypothetical protein VIV11_10825 [Kofleriaceae bacterium]